LGFGDHNLNRKLCRGLPCSVQGCCTYPEASFDRNPSTVPQAISKTCARDFSHGGGHRVDVVKQLKAIARTGDVGLAIYLWDYLTGVPRFPTVDVF
jgi:hypothetical protein